MPQPTAESQARERATACNPGRVREPWDDSWDGNLAADDPSPRSGRQPVAKGESASLGSEIAGGRPSPRGLRQRVAEGESARAKNNDILSVFGRMSLRPEYTLSRAASLPAADQLS